jgi:general secretion pathway protein D
LPQNARLDRANELFDRGRYQAAQNEARAVLAREPGNLEAKTLLEDAEVAIVVETRLKSAQAALKRGDRDTALAEVRAGLAANPSDARLMALFRELTQ